MGERTAMFGIPFSTKRSAMIKLGSKVRDVVTGFEGIAVAKVEYLTGCTQYGIAPRIDKDGKPQDAIYVDEARLEIVDGGVLAHFQRSQMAQLHAVAPGGDMGRDTPKR
jgi:hypothetical protein